MSLLSELTKTAARHGVAKKSIGSGVLGTVAGLVATRIATKSVPGAVLVGGAILGKFLWDKKKERDAQNGMPSRAPVAPKTASDAIIDQ
jgi:hypothetical protein